MITVTIDDVDVTDHINLSDGNLKTTCNAEQGSVGTNSFEVDDQLGEFDFVGLRTVKIYEDAAPAENQLVFWGWVFGEVVDRGDDAPTLAARKWTLTVQDINNYVARKVMAGNDTDRPAETDVERVQWLLSTGEAAWFADVTTFVDTADPVDMDAANYNGQMFQSVLDDCSQQAAKNYYIRWIWDTSDYVIAVWYGDDGAALAVSDLAISNFDDDVDAEVGAGDPGGGAAWTWAASMDSKLTRDPSRVYSGIFGNYDGGFTYRTRSATITDFANRDTIASWPNIKTLAKAQARGDLQLDKLAEAGEEDSIDTTIWVTPEHVNDAMAGDQITARYTHFPGYEVFRDCRVLNRTVTFLTPDVYQIDYTLAPLPPPVPPLECSTALSGADDFVSAITGSSCHNWVTGPIGQVISMSPGTPSLIIASMGFIECSFNPGPFVSCASPYTFLGPGTAKGTSAGYYANTTTGSTYSTSFTGGDVNWQATIAASIPTAATSPVQVGSLIGTGNSITLSSPPTAGNMLIAVSSNLRTGISPLTGWTQLAEDHSLVTHDGIHGMALLISARCVGEGESAVIPVPSSSYVHNTFLMEWAMV